MTASVHPTAIVHPGAEIGPACEVGPYTIIGEHVRLGRGNRIGPHVVIEGHTRIGDENHIFQFASIGSQPQDLKYHGEPSILEIGDGNVIREYVTLQPGTEQGLMKTAIGSSNLFMASAHVGHDCKVGDRNIFANSVAISGHVQIDNGVILGGMAGIHQYTRLGDLAFIGAGAMVAQDIPPYCMSQGDRAELIGLNQIGMKRAGISEEEIRLLRKVFRAAFKREGNFKDRIASLIEEHAGSRCASKFLGFLQESKRGVAQLRKDSRKASE